MLQPNTPFRASDVATQHFFEGLGFCNPTVLVGLRVLHPALLLGLRVLQPNTPCIAWGVATQHSFWGLGSCSLHVRVASFFQKGVKKKTGAKKKAPRKTGPPFHLGTSCLSNPQGLLHKGLVLEPRGAGQRCCLSDFLLSKSLRCVSSVRWSASRPLTRWQPEGAVR